MFVINERNSQEFLKMGFCRTQAYTGTAIKFCVSIFLSVIDMKSHVGTIGSGDGDESGRNILRFIWTTGGYFFIY